MADLWHPRARRNPAAESLWGTYTNGPPRGLLHTTESSGYGPTGPNPSATYDNFGHNYFPHATIVLENGAGVIYQHIPVNRAARALEHPAGTVQTNNATCVQCEIVWRAANAPAMPKSLLGAVADWMRWVEGAMGVPRRATKFAPPDVNVRMSDSVWSSFSGWCGHQHVPHNTHTDPGAIDIGYLLGSAPAPTPEEDDMTIAYTVTIQPGEEAPVPLPNTKSGLFAGWTAFLTLTTNEDKGKAGAWIGDGKNYQVQSDNITVEKGRKTGWKLDPGTTYAQVENKGSRPLSALVEGGKT